MTKSQIILENLPDEKEISINMIICTETGSPVKADKIVKELNKRDIVYVPIISGTREGTSPRTVIGFAAFKLKDIPTTGPNKPDTVMGNLMEIVNLKDLSTDYSSNIICKSDIIGILYFDKQTPLFGIKAYRGRKHPKINKTKRI